MDYEDVRAATQEEAKETEPKDPPEAEPKEAEPKEAEPKAPEAQEEPKAPEAQEEPKTPKVPPRKRGWPKKGEELSGRWTCPDCGGNFSVRTKKHACSKPRGLEDSSQAGADLPLGTACRDVPPVPAPGADPLLPIPREPEPPEPVVTFDMCREFLYGEVRARRDARRERISVSMF